jgi:hypothetical protein
VEAGFQTGLGVAESKDKGALANASSVLSPGGREVRLADELDRKRATGHAQKVFYRMPAEVAQSQDPAPARGRFALVQQAVTTLAAKKPAAPLAQVLANFVVEQTGDRLRVVDADNSIYEGQWFREVGAANAVIAAGTDPAIRLDADKPAAAPPAAIAGRLEQTRDATVASAQTWNFRVSGTNRTLRQPVTLEGVLLEVAETNQAVPTAPAPAGTIPLSSPPATRQAPALPVQNGAVAFGQQNNTAANLFNVRRIQGQVRVGPTNQAPFDAVRSGN